METVGRGEVTLPQITAGAHQTLEMGPVVVEPIDETVDFPPQGVSAVPTRAGELVNSVNYENKSLGSCTIPMYVVETFFEG